MMITCLLAMAVVSEVGGQVSWLAMMVLNWFNLRCWSFGGTHACVCCIDGIWLLSLKAVARVNFS